MDRELADVSAREEQRLDDERVRREGERAAPVRGQQGAVAERRQQRVPELGQEQRLDQGVRRLPTGTVRERDALIEQLAPRPPPPLLDALEYLLLAWVHHVSTGSRPRRRANRPKL